MTSSPRCFGAQDDKGPACDGPDVRRCHITGPFVIEPFFTYYCAECREIARREHGFFVQEVGFFSLRTTAEFYEYPLDSSAISFGRRMAHIIYWRDA